MKILLIVVLTLVLALFSTSTAVADYAYLSPVNPGSVAYVGYYCPAGMTYTYPAYSYPVAVGRFAARPVVAAVPVAAQPMIGAYYPTVVAQPVVAVPGAVIYPAPVVVRQKVFYPGQPVRNVIRGVLP